MAVYNHYKRIQHSRELSASQLAQQEAAAARAAERDGPVVAADVRGLAVDEVELDKSNLLLLGPTGSGKARGRRLAHISHYLSRKGATHLAAFARSCTDVVSDSSVSLRADAPRPVPCALLQRALRLRRRHHPHTGADPSPVAAPRPCATSRLCCLTSATAAHGR